MLAQKLGLSLPTIKKVGGGAAFENLYSLDFDHPSKYVDFGDLDIFTPNDSGANRGFSVSFWVKTTTNRNIILSKNATGQLEWTVGIGKSGAFEAFLYSGNSGSDYIVFITESTFGSFINLSDGNWHHVAFTFDLTTSATSCQVWIDNVNFDSTSGATQTFFGTFVSVSNTTAPMIMSTPNTTFIGNLDEVAMFDDVLTLTNVADIYNSGTPNDISGINYLIGWWRNGDILGTAVYPTIDDYSTNSNAGTMTAMASGDIVTDVP